MWGASASPVADGELHRPCASSLARCLAVALRVAFDNSLASSRKTERDPEGLWRAACRDKLEARTMVMVEVQW